MGGGQGRKTAATLLIVPVKGASIECLRRQVVLREISYWARQATLPPLDWTNQQLLIGHQFSYLPPDLVTGLVLWRYF